MTSFPFARVAGVLAAIAASVLAQQPASRQVQVFGQRIHYVEAGSGPNVILLHGLGGDETNWAQTIPALAGRYHVVVPDQIGFGQSDKPLINYRIGTLVDFLEEFCAKLGIARASVVASLDRKRLGARTLIKVRKFPTEAFSIRRLEGRRWRLRWTLTMGNQCRF